MIFFLRSVVHCVDTVLPSAVLAKWELADMHDGAAMASAASTKWHPQWGRLHMHFDAPSPEELPLLTESQLLLEDGGGGERSTGELVKSRPASPSMPALLEGPE